MEIGIEIAVDMIFAFLCVLAGSTCVVLFVTMCGFTEPKETWAEPSPWIFMKRLWLKLLPWCGCLWFIGILAWVGIRQLTTLMETLP